MVRALQPYIVTSWHGHRDDPDLPEAVQTVWQQKFATGHKPRPRSLPTKPFAPRSPEEHRPRQSNVDIAILDSDGNVVRWFERLHGHDADPAFLSSAARLDSSAEPCGKFLASDEVPHTLDATNMAAAW